ncbi:type I-E CRISPR-associated protein Cas6/Cse3/CasE [Aeromonas enteropelogenes]|uniref:type I-E CRISPR-associated protein Cas6/Cse3/CasE n=1 Tax=Aeromonas enteropelogenes TaxID=29489 RepID=UPI003B9E07D2
MSLYASVLRLDCHAIKALRITDLYSLHRVVYDLFEDVRSEVQKHASEPSGIQWADKGGDEQYRQILLLSDRLPKESEHGEVVSRPLPPAFLAHDHYRFSVILSPTRRDRLSRQLIPVRGREAIATWFTERAPVNWGFTVDTQRLQVGDVRVQQFKAKAGRLVTLQQVTLNGYLTVTNPEQFTRSIATGIGRSRTFGCGLMQVVPVIEQPTF